MSPVAHGVEIKTTFWLMLLLTNEYDRTIDAKGRLQIPSQIREQIQADDRSGVLYLVPGDDPETLELHLAEDFEKLATTIQNELIPHRDIKKFKKMLYSQATRLEMDKQGRVNLPMNKVSRAKLGTEVVLTGAGTHLVLWNKDVFRAFVDDTWGRWAEVQALARAASEKSSPE